MKFALELVCAADTSSSEVIGATGPGFFGHLIKTTRYKRLPTISLYPYLFNEPFSAVFSRDLSKTYGIHVWHNSWFPTELKILKINSMILSGSPFEVQRLWDELGPLQAEAPQAHGYTSRVRRARTEMIEICLNTILGTTASSEALPEFELFKTCHYLLSKNPDAVVWQIGAGDGTTEDPLRAVLINFDPTAILVEANPYLHDQLKENYVRNKRAKFINATVASQSGRAQLLAVNPHTMRSLGMPESTVNLSSVYFDGRSSLGNACLDEFKKQALLKCLEMVDLPAVDIEQIRGVSEGKSPDVLVVNIGGAEDELVVDALQKGCQPTVLMFNTKFMANEAREKILSTLGGGYKVFHFDGYSIGYKVDFLIDYCTTMFVEHGLPTMFKKPLGIIAGVR